MCTVFIASLGLIHSNAHAAVIDVTVNISKVDGVDLDLAPFNDSDFYSKITINNSYWQSPIIFGEDDVSPSDWNTTASLVVDSLTSWDIPIAIEVWDHDDASDHEQLDISSIGNDLNISYNLKNRCFSGDASSSPSSGDNGTIWFEISSTELKYHNWGLNVSWAIKNLPGAGARYKVDYLLENYSDNTFDLKDFGFFDLLDYKKFGFTDIGPSIIPGGESYPWSMTGTRLFYEDNVKTFALFDDLDETKSFQNYGLFYTVPEPSTLSLMAASLAVISFARMKIRVREQ
jgi:hypothetical protein